jgi:ribosomal protein S18 acetylase RimI-like enzyme
VTAPRVDVLLAGHRPRVEEILRATGAFREEEIDVALELVDDATRANSSGDYAALGAFDAEGRLAGYACFGPTPGTDGTFDLYWIATDPTLHGAGHGRALVAAIERDLRARGGRLVVAETSTRDDYAATRRFYLKAGFVEAATVADFYAPGDGRALFTRRIAATAQVAAVDPLHDARHDEWNGRAADGTETGGRASNTPTRAPDGRGAAAR